MKISQANSTKFSYASGDFNPIHLDNIYARRTQFGNTIPHGINILIHSLEYVADDLVNKSIDRIVSTFHQFLLTDEEFAVEYTYSNDETIRITVFTKKCIIQRTEIYLGDYKSNCNVDNEIFFKSLPVDLQLTQMQSFSGTDKLSCNFDLLHQLYPRVSKLLPIAQLCALTVTSRLVGMNCPGMNSLFTGIDLKFNTFANYSKDVVGFEVKRFDRRFNLLSIDLSHSEFYGTLNCMIRAQPVKQMSFKEIYELVPNDLFHDRKMLVVGGSRGLGEVCAKILAAGGADVVITYNQGQSEAQLIVDEILSYNMRARAIHLNINDLVLNNKFLLNQTDLEFLDLLYFTTPKIVANQSSEWDRGIYDNYTKYYIDSIGSILNQFNIGNYTKEKQGFLFMPSTAFINEPEYGYYEYSAAKASMEIYGKFLISRFKNMKVYSPRLPRIKTDQTAGVKSNLPDAFSILYPLLSGYASDLNAT